MADDWAAAQAALWRRDQTRLHGAPLDRARLVVGDDVRVETVSGWPGDGMTRSQAAAAARELVAWCQRYDRTARAR